MCVSEGQQLLWAEVVCDLKWTCWPMRYGSSHFIDLWWNTDSNNFFVRCPRKKEDLPYAYDAVVRKKLERRLLNGYACQECFQVSWEHSFTKFAFECVRHYFIFSFHAGMDWFWLVLIWGQYLSGQVCSPRALSITNHFTECIRFILSWHQRKWPYCAFKKTVFSTCPATTLMSAQVALYCAGQIFTTHCWHCVFQMG